MIAAVLLFVTAGCSMLGNLGLGQGTGDESGNGSLGDVLGSVLGGVLGGLGSQNTVDGLLGLVIGSVKVQESELYGAWYYAQPACAFTSENLLAKAGGEVAAAQIEEKVKPYYDQVGISASNTQITFNQDGTFSSRIAGTNFSGTYTFDESSQQIKLKGLLLSINCYTKREINGISILFEAKKLLTVLQTMSALSGNANLQTIGDLSKQYDGVRVGFDMKR